MLSLLSLCYHFVITVFLWCYQCYYSCITLLSLLLLLSITVITQLSLYYNAGSTLLLLFHNSGTVFVVRYFGDMLEAVSLRSLWRSWCTETSAVITSLWTATTGSSWLTSGPHCTTLPPFTDPYHTQTASGLTSRPTSSLLGWWQLLWFACVNDKCNFAMVWVEIG